MADSPGKLAAQAYWAHRFKSQGRWDTESTLEASWEVAALAGSGAVAAERDAARLERDEVAAERDVALARVAEMERFLDALSANQAFDAMSNGQ